MASNVVVSKKVFKRGAKRATQVVESFKMFDSNVHLSLIDSEITEGPQSDVLVNCTGPHYEHHSGISAAITRAAGKGLIQEYERRLKEKGHLNYSKIAMTPPFNLGDRHQLLFHIRSPSIVYNSDYFGNQQVSLTWLTYSQLLQAAFVDHDLESMSMPVIGTGACGLPIEKSVADLVQAVHDFVRDANYNAQKKVEIFVINNDRRKIQTISETIESTLEYIYATEKRLAQAKPSSTKATALADAHNHDDKDKSTGQDVKAASAVEEQNTCVICLDEVPRDPKKAKKLDKCGHEFCKDCIESYFESAKKSCPVCNTVYGISAGTQPDGKMDVRVTSQCLPGYPAGTKTIEISYTIRSGVQGPQHPHPGRSFSGTHRTAYLPDTTEGREVLGLLKKAFDHRLIFTIGQSRTTGLEDTVTWNDIHHKTSMHGGSSNFGYPDPTYLNRVKQELADKGIC